MKEYYQCGICKNVDIKANWQVLSGNLICPDCGNPGVYSTWPSPDILDLFVHAMEYPHNSQYYGLITSVFVCTALELLLERLIFVVAREDKYWEEVDYLIEHLLEAYQGRERRQKLFGIVGYGSFSSQVKLTGNKNFNKHWDDLAKIRNNCVHGKVEDSNKVKPSQLKLFINESLDVFSKLTNAYNQETLQHKIANDNKESKVKEAEMLRKWIDNSKSRSK